MMCWINVLFAVTVVFAWSLVGTWLADPISAAAESSVTTFSRPDLLEYPYLVLWMLPIAGSLTAWLADRMGLTMFAKVAVSYPLLLMGLSYVWFHWLMYL